MGLYSNHLPGYEVLELCKTHIDESRQERRGGGGGEGVVQHRLKAAADKPDVVSPIKRQSKQN